MTPLLEARGLSAGYGGIPVIREIDLAVEAGEVVCLLGPNGAGKTTTMLTLAGDLPALAGEVLLHGSATRAPLFRRARSGLAYVTEERSVFKGLSTADNLRVGKVDREAVLGLFPELEDRLAVPGGMLSGGEQQMLSLGRALARRPSVLLADELSLGLAPLVVNRLLQAVRDAATERGTAVLIVEQHVHKALEYADRVFVLNRGRIVLALGAAEAAGRLAEITKAYL